MTGPKQMPRLEVAVPGTVSLKKEVPVDNTLEEFSYEQCQKEEMKEKGPIKVFILDTAGPHHIMIRIASKDLSVKLGQLEVRFTRIRF